MAPPRPMFAVTGDLPAGPDWRFELKWDGVRITAGVDADRARLWGRNGREATDTYPELAGLAGAVAPGTVLDGEVVAFDAAGRPDFGLLQARMHVGDPARAARLAVGRPVVYLVFDLLALGGRPLLDDTYVERRRALEGLGLAGPAWQVPPSFGGDGSTVLRAAAEAGLEGVVAKRASSRYLPGRRSRDWVKVKIVRRQEVVVGGWEPGGGTRQGRIGALLVGVHERGRLRYAGQVGTGFSATALADLAARLAPLRRPESPFDDVPPEQARHAVWARPELVGEVRFTEWTADGRMRHPSWLGLRTDVDPAAVVREPTSGPTPD